MNALFDTNVLLAGVVQAHPFHSRAHPWMEKALSGRIGYYICQHSLAEMYSVLTILKVQPRIFPELAKRLIKENTKAAKVVPLAARDYRWCISQLSDLAEADGVIYDALIARAALKARVDRLLTFNPEDFRRVLLEEQHEMILVPS